MLNQILYNENAYIPFKSNSDYRKVECDMPRRKKRTTKQKIMIGVGIVVAVVVFAVLCIIGTLHITKYRIGSKPHANMVVINTSTLQEILDVNQISTFQAVYNGIAAVMSEKKPDQVSYYVSYDAKVSAGIDMKKIGIEVDEEKKIINIRIPEVTLEEPKVDYGSLQFIFVDKSAETSTVSLTAYNKCIDDVTEEIKDESAIRELAKQNAINTVKALIEPFVKQLDSDYVLVIE